MAKFVLWGTYSPDVLERRGPFREEHLAGLRQQKEQGLLLTLGPTVCTTRVFGLYEAESQEQVEDLVMADVYWRQGIWTCVEVFHWIQAF
jgi:uncharacterized protein YciI